MKYRRRFLSGGFGAGDVKECFLIQMAQSSDDYSFESQLISQHMGSLLENHLPEIAKKLNCSIEDVNRAIERMSNLDTSPGLQIGIDRNRPVTADVIVEELDVSDQYQVRLADYSMPALRVSDYYQQMAKSKKVSKGEVLVRGKLLC